VGLVADKVVLGQVLTKNFGFPCQSSFHQFLHHHNHLTVGQMMNWEEDSRGPMTILPWHLPRSRGKPQDTLAKIQMELFLSRVYSVNPTPTHMVFQNLK
jgi:hypothetical protein